MNNEFIRCFQESRLPNLRVFLTNICFPCKLFKLKKIVEKKCLTKSVKASDEFVRNLFIQDQIKSSSNILGFKKKITYTFVLIHVENINANFQPIFLVNEPEKK